MTQKRGAQKQPKNDEKWTKKMKITSCFLHMPGADRVADVAAHRDELPVQIRGDDARSLPEINERGGLSETL